MKPPDQPCRPFPVLGILSVVVVPTNALLTFLAAMLLDWFLKKPATPMSTSTALPGTAHATAPVILACLAVGVVSGLIAVATGERPRWLPLVGLGLTALLVTLFVTFE